MDSIVIIILNYEAYRETEKCIDSIIKKKLHVTGIVVVDNASQNESYSYLKTKYKNDYKIKIVRCNKNLGFAKGNNIGIKVAKMFWNPKFILLLNSDTVIIESNYLEQMINEYEHGVGVIQTNVLRLNGRYTKKNYGMYDLVDLFLEFVKHVASYYYLYFPKHWKRSVKRKLGPWISGCDIMLTPDYLKVFNGVYPLTFLYGEEHIMAIMLKKADLEWRIVENAHILHAESRSTPHDLKIGTRKKDKMMLITTGHKILVRLLPLKALIWIINYGKWQND